MRAGECKTQLAALSKGLAMDWEKTRQSWRDAKAQEFEENYMVPLESAVNSALTVIEELDKVLNKIRKDCE